MSTHLASLSLTDIDAALAGGMPGLLGDLRCDHAGETGAAARRL